MDWRVGWRAAWMWVLLLPFGAEAARNVRGNAPLPGAARDVTAPPEADIQLQRRVLPLARAVPEEGSRALAELAWSGNVQRVRAETGLFSSPALEPLLEGVTIHRFESRSGPSPVLAFKPGFSNGPNAAFSLRW